MLLDMAGLSGVILLIWAVNALVQAPSPSPTGTGSSTPVTISLPSIPAAATAAASKPPTTSNTLTLTSLSTTTNPPISSAKTTANTSHPSTSNGNSTTNQTALLPPSTSNENSTTNQSSSQTTPSPQPNTTMTATTDFIDPEVINQTKPTKLPAKIKTKFPSSCKDFSVEYKCSGINDESVELSDMKPFTNYSCTGDIKMNNVSINKTLPPVQFNIDCDFKVEKLEISTTNTSIELNWETTSDNCQDVLNKLDELSYRCSCKQQKGDGRNFTIEEKTMNQSERRTCHFNKGIKPFKDYNCEVRHIYTGQRYFREKRVTEKTKPGIPDQPHDIVVTVPENNKIEVTCSFNNRDFNGPDKIFRAQLQGVDGSRKNNTKCQFQFEDLSYSTSYTVEVFAFNGHFTSSPVRSRVDTRYNNKALIGSLVFLIIFIILCAAFFILKRKISRNVNEEQNVYSTVIYANMPPRKHNEGN